MKAILLGILFSFSNFAFAQTHCELENGGIIGSDQILCEIGQTPEPFTSIAEPESDYDLEYFWIKTTVEPTVSVVNWDNIPNSNSPTYQAGPLSETTWFRRCVRVEGCMQFMSESNILRVCVDTAPPTFTYYPQDLIIECDEEVPLLYPQATDACSDEITMDYSIDTLQGDCTPYYHVTWVLTDECGHSSDPYVQKITTVDEEGPNIMLVEPFASMLDENNVIKRQCDDPLIIPPNSAVVVTDNCDSNPEYLGMEETSEHGDCDEDGFILRFTCDFIAKDHCDNYDTLRIYIEYVDTLAPEMSMLYPYNGLMNGDTLTYQCNEEHVFELEDVYATDTCDDELEMNLDVTAHEGNCTEDGYLRITQYTWTATDDCGNVGYFNAYIKTIDTIAPMLNLYPEIEEGATYATIECDEDYPEHLTYEVSDDCDNEVTVTLEVIDHAGDCAEDGYINRRQYTFTATDDCDNATSRTYYVNVVDTQAPTIVLNDYENGQMFTTQCDNVNLPLFDEYNATIEDNCEYESHFEYSVEEGNCAETGYLEHRTYTWTATDACNNTTTFTVYEQIVDIVAPVISLTGYYNYYNSGDTLLAECNSPLYFTMYNAEASDDCSGLESFTIDSTTVEGNCAVDGYLTITTYTYTAADFCGNTSDFVVSVRTEDNNNPMISVGDYENGQVIYMPCDEHISFSEEDVYATDACDEDLDIAVNQESTMGNCLETGYFESVTWTFEALDDCGNSAMHTIHVHYIDNVAPEFTYISEYEEVECGTPIEFETPTYEDNCDDNVTLEYEDVVVGDHCIKKHLRTWTITDACGNSNTTTQAIYEIDTQAPVFAELFPIEASNCYYPLEITMPTVMDCYEDVEVTYTIDTLELENAVKYQINWHAYDLCYNHADTFQIVQVPCNEGLTFDYVNATMQTDGNTAELSWNVFNEQPNGYYLVNKIRGEGNIQEIARIQQAEGRYYNEYTFIDEKPALGNNIYQIRYFSEEFGLQYSEQFSIWNEGQQNTFNVFPTPATDNVYLQIRNQDIEEFELEIVNLSGIVIMRKKGMNENGFVPVSIDELESGIYFIRITADNVRTSVAKLIKE